MSVLLLVRDEVNARVFFLGSCVCFVLHAKRAGIFVDMNGLPRGDVISCFLFGGLLGLDRVMIQE